MFPKMENFCFIAKSQTTKNQAWKVSNRKTLLFACSFCLAKVRQIILAEKRFYRKFSGFFKAAISCVKFFRIRQEIFIVCPQIFICWRDNFYSAVLNAYSTVLNTYSAVLNIYSTLLNKHYLRQNLIYKGAGKIYEAGRANANNSLSAGKRNKRQLDSCACA